MALSANEQKIFFDNFLGLLAYVNDRHSLVKDFGHPKGPRGLKAEPLQKITDTLWKNVSLIDDYIESIWDMPAERIQLLRSWKKRIAGEFYIVRHLKKYTVFFDGKKDRLYGITGITNDLEETLPKEELPLLVEAVLLPFGDRIIYDSLMRVYDIGFGGGIRRDIHEEYMNLKKEKGIISTFRRE